MIPISLLIFTILIFLYLGTWTDSLYLDNIKYVIFIYLIYRIAVLIRNKREYTKYIAPMKPRI